MATPATAGVAAIVRQYFVDGYYPSGMQNATDSMDPSGVLIKTVIMNGAQQISTVSGSSVSKIFLCYYFQWKNNVCSYGKKTSTHGLLSTFNCLRLLFMITM